MCKGLSKNYVVQRVGRWVKRKTLRLHYVWGEGGGIRQKHYVEHYVFFPFLFSEFSICVGVFCVFVLVIFFSVSTFNNLRLQTNSLTTFFSFLLERTTWFKSNSLLEKFIHYCASSPTFRYTLVRFWFFDLYL